MKRTKINFPDHYILPIITGALSGFPSLSSKQWQLLHNFMAFIPLLITAHLTLNIKKSFLSFVSHLLIISNVNNVFVNSCFRQTVHPGFLIGILIIIT